MQNANSDIQIARAEGDFQEQQSALGRLFARRPVRLSDEPLLLVGDEGDGADVDADEVEVADLGAEDER